MIAHPAHDVNILVTFSRRPAGARAANPSPSLWPLPVPTLALAARLSAQLRHVFPRVGCGVQDHVVCWVVLFRVGVVGSAVAAAGCAAAAVAAAAAAAAAASIFLNVSVHGEGTWTCTCDMCMHTYTCVSFFVSTSCGVTVTAGDSERVTVSGKSSVSVFYQKNKTPFEPTAPSLLYPLVLGK